MIYNKARQKSKAALKQAMLEMMRTKPLRSITVTELCGRCSLNRSTFYAYYPTIEHLIGDLHRDLFLLMEESLCLTPGGFGMHDEVLFTQFLIHICQEDERFRLFLRNDDANLFEQHMVSHFLDLLCPTDAALEQRFSLIYHMVGAFTLLCEWIRMDFPCEAEVLARQIIALASQRS